MFEQIMALLALDPSVWAVIATLLASGLAFGTITASNTVQGANTFYADIIATATADASITIAHGLGATKAAAGSPFAGLGPQDFAIVGRNAIGRKSAWVIETVNTTSVTITKISATATASSAVQATLSVARPSSLAR